MKARANYILGHCRVEQDANIIYLNDEARHLQPKFIEVLNLLVSAYPRVVSRQEIIDLVWDGNTFVGEKALTNAIWHLRQALDQDDHPEVISTIRKTGYRLLIQPEYLDDDIVDDSKTPQHKPVNPIKLIGQYRAVLLSILGLIAIVGGVFYYNSDSSVQAIAQRISLTTTQITTEPRLELHPSTSAADGKYLVYVWLPPKHPGNLYRRDLQQPNLGATQITFDNWSQGRSVWSHDNRYLYFTRKDLQADLCDIVRLTMSTLEETVMGHCVASEGPRYIDISPDDHFLAYSGIFGKETKQGIYLLDLHDSGFSPKRLSCADCDFTDYDVAFSPNGEKLAISRRFGPYREELVLIDLETGKEQLLTEGEADIVGITWLNDNDTLIYAVQTADIRTGYILDINTGERVALKFDGFSYPDFNAATQKLYYQHRDERYNVSALALDKTVTQAPTPVLLSQFNSKEADYCKATNQIAYLSNETGAYEIWIKDVDGLERQQLTQNSRIIHYPVWSHDCRFIAFKEADANGKTSSLYTLEVATLKITRVKSPFTKFLRPAWSFDNSKLLSAVSDKGKQGMYQFDLISDAAPVLLPMASAKMVQYLDENTLIYSTKDHSVWLYDIANEQASLLLEKQQLSSAYSWVADDNGIYFVNRQDDYNAIQYVDFKQRKTHTLVHLPLGNLKRRDRITLDETGNQLLFTNTQFYQSDIREASFSQ